MGQDHDMVKNNKIQYIFPDNHCSYTISIYITKTISHILFCQVIQFQNWISNTTTTTLRLPGTGT